MLEAVDVCSYYGRAQILSNVSVNIRKGEVVVLLGRNGAGKSTTMKTLMGLVKPTQGRVEFDGKRIDGLLPYQIAQLGLGFVPEERRVFTDLTVMENLATGRRPPRPTVPSWTPARLFELFPNLGEMKSRRGGRMSGGEQQMLTIARTLMGNPSCILLDEPSEGLAPVIVDMMANAIGTLKSEGVSIVLSEQNLHFATAVADRAYIIEKGEIRYEGSIEELSKDHHVREQYLSI